MDLILPIGIAVAAIVPIIILYWRNSMTKITIETEYCWKNGAVDHYKTLEDFEGKMIRIIWKGKVAAEKEIDGMPHEIRTGAISRKRRYYAMEGVNTTLDPFDLNNIMSERSPFFNYQQKMIAVLISVSEAIQHALKKGKISLWTNFFWMPLGLVFGILMAVLLNIHIGG